MKSEVRITNFFADHGGSTPISIGSISTKNVTINQQLCPGDPIQAGGIKSTGRGNEVPESFELPPPPPEDDAAAASTAQAR